MIRPFFITCIFSCSIFFVNNTHSQDVNGFPQVSHSSRGGIGLINTPTARFSDDGEFGLGLSIEAPYNRLFGKVQFFPWMVQRVDIVEGGSLNNLTQSYFIFVLLFVEAIE